MPDYPNVKPVTEDAWKHRSMMMRCRGCMWFVGKHGQKVVDADMGVLGRCRRHAPALGGWPAVFSDADWCGDHKLDETKL
jgi:hypothetical protein